MKILYIYLYCNLGGITSVLYNRLRLLKDRGVETEIIFIYDRGGTVFWKNQNIKFKVLNKFLNIAWVKKFLKNRHYDHIIIIDYPEMYNALEKSFSRKLIYEIHTTVKHNLIKISSIVKKLNKIVVPSLYFKKYCMEEYDIREKKIKVIPNVVDGDLFRYYPNVKTGVFKIIGWVGKIDFIHKNIQEALLIFKEVCKKNKKSFFYIITGGTPSTEAETLFFKELYRLKLLKHVLWIHNLDYEKMPVLYSEIAKSGGILLNTSINESYGMAIHESIRCNVPVVSSNNGAILEIIKNGKNGFIYELGKINEAAKKINILMNDCTKYKKFVSENKKIIASINQEKIIQDYIEYLNKN